jgi:serine/threonine-protein kinase
VSPADLIGYTLPGGFEIVRHLATGGFAWVYEAQTPERAPCAVKVPHQRNEQSLKRFVREIKVLRELPRSPYCVRYVGDGHLPDGLPFVAMELVDGRTLANILQPGVTWDVRAACAIGTQLCAALRGMHRLGLANRDVNPNNVMLTVDNYVKLMDFGLVKDAQGLLELMEEEDILAGRDFAEDLDFGLVLGTLDYAAPEQLSDSKAERGEHTRTDTWSDVYSVALILWQMLTGKKLFSLDMSGTDQQIVARRVLAYIEERTQFDVDELSRPLSIPKPLFEILRRALRLDPRRRHRSALQLGQELTHYLETGQGSQEEEPERTQAVRLEDYLALLDAGAPAAAAADGDDEDEEEKTTVYRPGSGEEIRILSSIPVDLDFDDQTSVGDVHIPAHDPPPSETGDPDLDAVLAELDAEARGKD